MISLYLKRSVFQAFFGSSTIIPFLKHPSCTESDSQNGLSSARSCCRWLILPDFSRLRTRARLCHGGGCPNAASRSTDTWGPVKELLEVFIHTDLLCLRWYGMLPICYKMSQVFVYVGSHSFHSLDRVLLSFFSTALSALMLKRPPLAFLHIESSQRWHQPTAGSHPNGLGLVRNTWANVSRCSECTSFLTC